jgi:hypothetical protein
MAGAPLLDKTYTESDLNSEFDTSDILGTNYEWMEEDFYRRFAPVKWDLLFPETSRRHA